MPGSWPSHRPTLTPSTPPFLLRIQSLDIGWAEDPGRGRGTPSSVAALTTLLSYTQYLTALALHSPCLIKVISPAPSLPNFRAPCLSHLVEINLRGLVADPDAIMSLMVPSKATLQRVRFTFVALEGGSWADVWRFLGKEPRNLIFQETETTLLEDWLFEAES